MTTTKNEETPKPGVKCEFNLIADLAVSAFIRNPHEATPSLLVRRAKELVVELGKGGHVSFVLPTPTEDKEVKDETSKDR